MHLLKNNSLVAVFLIAVSVVVAILSSLGANETALLPLFIADAPNLGFAQVLSGQMWRLITPIFIHFGPMHLIFNLLWVWDLTRPIETRKGIGFLVLFVLVVGLISNLAQYLLTGSPYFGGLSGVVYALLGYLWMQGRFDPNANVVLRQNTVLWMLGWFVLCWTGLLGPIANWAHTAGLIVGVIWGFLAAKLGRPTMAPIQ